MRHLFLILIIAIPFSLLSQPTETQRAMYSQETLSAAKMARAGAVMYGVGYGVSVIGGIITFIEVLDQVEYAEGESQFEIPVTGLIISLVGGSVSFAGSIISNSAGSRAKNIYMNSGRVPPRFKGWGYWATGLGLSVIGSSIQYAGVPLIGGVFSITGEVFTIASIVHSVRYSRTASYDFAFLKDVRVVPIALNGKAPGAILTATF